MHIYAVIDTNVLVSALLSSHPDSATSRLLNQLQGGSLIPMYNEVIFMEYKEVLHRAKFHLPKEAINIVLSSIIEFGVSAERIFSKETFIDPKDIVFYEVAFSRDDAYLVSGNLKHFPKNQRIVSPSEMMDILENSDLVDQRG